MNLKNMLSERSWTQKAPGDTVIYCCLSSVLTTIAYVCENASSCSVRFYVPFPYVAKKLGGKAMTYKVCPGNIQPLLIEWERFARHPCNLAAKDSRLECTCVNNDDFTVLVSGGGRCHWVSVCTVWASYSKCEQSHESASNFAWSLNIPPWKLFGSFRRPQLWAAGDWQLHHNVLDHESHLVQFFG